MGVLSRAIPISDAREHLSELGDRVAHEGERVVVKRRNKEVFALVSLEDLALLEETEDKWLLKIAKERENEPRISLEEAKKRLGV